jgi:hypothetical protein
MRVYFERLIVLAVTAILLSACSSDTMSDEAADAVGDGPDGASSRVDAKISCHTDEECQAKSQSFKDSYLHPESLRCDTSRSICVECSDDADCGEVLAILKKRVNMDRSSGQLDHRDQRLLASAA